MRLLPLTSAAVLLTAITAAAQITGIVSLEQLKHRARPLLLFAPKPDDPRLEIQVRTLQQHGAEAQDRDLVPLGLPYNSPSPTPAQLPPEEAVALRRRFHVAPEEFAVILLGKDGGSKLRSDKPLSIQKLIDTIDAMPMRQDEMRGKEHP